MAGAKHISDLGRNVDFSFKPVVNLAEVFNTSSPAADANLLSAGVTATILDHGYVRVYACFSAEGQLSVRRTRGEATVTEILNGGTNLAAGCGYIFDVKITSSDALNFRYSAGSGTTNMFSVDEYCG